MEAVSFYHNKGSERKMENYYDTIKILSVHNAQLYQPKQVTLENMDINIPDIVDTLTIDTHPIQVQLNDIFFNQKVIVLGLDSQIIDHIKKDEWEIKNLSIDKKMKEKVIVKQIKELDNEFNLCLLNTKFPIWLFYLKVIKISNKWIQSLNQKII